MPKAKRRIHCHLEESEKFIHLSPCFLSFFKFLHAPLGKPVLHMTAAQAVPAMQKSRQPFRADGFFVAW
jgi:hypothetical protein